MNSLMTFEEIGFMFNMEETEATSNYWSEAALLLKVRLGLCSWRMDQQCGTSYENMNRED